MKKLSDAGAALILELEGFSPDAYRDQGGVWTIGYGTTRIGTQPITPGMRLNQAVAAAIFRWQLGGYERELNDLLDSYSITVSQGQFDALLSFAYNVGIKALERSSLWSHLDSGTPIEPHHFTDWNKYQSPPGSKHFVVSDGLTARRLREYQRFTAG